MVKKQGNANLKGEVWRSLEPKGNEEKAQRLSLSECQQITGNHQSHANVKMSQA